MCRAARVWRCAGFLMLGGVLLSGISASGGDEPPLSDQLADLGRQALAQGASKTAQTFFEKALTLDPSHAGAARGLKEIERSHRDVVRVAYQEPKPGPAPAGGAAAAATTPPSPAEKATIEQSQVAENIARQQLTNDVEQHMANARALLNSSMPEAALNALRLTQNIVRSATNVSEADRAKLDRRIQAQLMATVQSEERVLQERAERQRLDASAEQRTRTVDLFERNKEYDAGHDDPV